jgi:hypothetical protein
MGTITWPCLWVGQEALKQLPHKSSTYVQTHRHQGLQQPLLMAPTHPFSPSLTKPGIWQESKKAAASFSSCF